MSRGLDHCVHAVRDLAAAADFYHRLGFTVGARNQHPWGTHNHLVQLPGFFVELLTLAEPDKLGEDGFSRLFGAYNGDFLKRGEGLSLMILQSDDARADETAFRAAGIAASGAMRFEREGKRPDGSPVKVAFSLTFAENPLAPDIHFAVCQQHYPENFWNPAFQKHANGATGVAGAVVVADAPQRHSVFFEAFVGTKAVEGEGGLSLATPRGLIDVMTPSAFTGRYGVAAPDLSRGARLAALRFTVADPSLMQGVPEFAGLAGLDAGGPTAIGADDAMGAALVFEAGR